MSKKELHKQMFAESGLPPEGSEARPAAFYRVTCPECGEDTLELIDYGVFLRSDFLGMNSDGEKGCGDLELDSDEKWVVTCRSCGCRPFDDASYSPQQLLQWAREAGEQKEISRFSCPICGSKTLYQSVTGVEMIRVVTAACPISDGNAEVALYPFEQVLGSGLIRYRCPKGHELAKDDGTPVETAEELVEWLDCRSASENG
jgi:predicted RNA-binding Zn-ribbon protein involved in translation (DUF1610 family)